MSGARDKRRKFGKAGLALAAGLVLVGAARSAHGCFIRSHHWRLVLGETDAGVVVLDLPPHTEERMVRCQLGQRGCDEDLFARRRTSAGWGERHEISWNGPASLALFTENGRALKLLARLPVKQKSIGFWPNPATSAPRRSR